MVEIAVILTHIEVIFSVIFLWVMAGFEGEFYLRTVNQILCCLNLFWL
jgi:hypothetical protein